MNKIKLLLFATLLATTYSFSQNNTEQLKQINEQVWEQFTKAFETSDYNLFGSLHSSDLIRVGADGKRILNKEPYIKGYENRWSSNPVSRTISFRFIERIANEFMGSERGIYKLTINPNTKEEQSYYGKFHVILKKENSIWKLVVDYDSSENNTINEKTYLDAFHQNDLDKY